MLRYEQVTQNKLAICLMVKPFYVANSVITGRNEIVARVIFLHLSVIHSVHRGGRGCASVHAWIPPPRTRPSRSGTTPLRTTPPQSRQTPPRDHTPPWDQTPPGSRLQHTVYERPVRILLECILVNNVVYEKIIRLFVMQNIRTSREICH